MNKIAISFIIFILFIPLTIYASDFDFYGLKFGDTEDKVNKIFPLSGNSQIFKKVRKPGQGMLELYFNFDNNNCLYCIQVHYVLGFGAEREIARIQAIDELFIQPLQKQKDIEVKTETRIDSSGFKYLVLTLVSKSLQNEYIKQLKREFIQEMK